MNDCTLEPMIFEWMDLKLKFENGLFLLLLLLTGGEEKMKQLTDLIDVSQLVDENAGVCVGVALVSRIQGQVQIREFGIVSLRD